MHKDDLREGMTLYAGPLSDACGHRREFVVQKLATNDPLYHRCSEFYIECKAGKHMLMWDHNGILFDFYAEKQRVY